MTITPEALEAELSLVSAAARFEFLARRDARSDANTASDAHEDDFFFQVESVGSGLDQQEALELLALGEVISRKARDSRQLAVGSALRAGASWTQIAAALDTSPHGAWEGHDRWLGEQADLHGRGRGGLAPAVVAAGRELAGSRPH